MTIVLKYTTVDGTQEQAQFDDDVAEIDLRTLGITDIDLTPLASCTSLQILLLNHNQLQTINLTPLATCDSLLALWLNDTKLQTIDLTPLASLRVYRLRLDNYQFQSEDAIHSWLINPVFVLQEWVVYVRPMNSYPWSFLYQVVEQFGANHRVQQDILCAMSLRDYGFIDCDLSELFRSLPEDTHIDEARAGVREKLLEEILRAVDQEGATTGLRLEEMSHYHVNLAKKAQDIIELRAIEVRQVVVGVRDTEVDLQELYLTAYGYEILTALGMRLTSNLVGLEQIKTSFTKLGFELKTGETSVSGVKMSDELKQTIWWIAENRGRPWSWIKEPEE